MDHAKPKASAGRRYEDFQPSTEWVQEKGSHTLVIYLPGFRKEQLKVQVTSTGNVRVSGERPFANHRWSRFREERAVPLHCDINAISARFEGGMLYVKLPNKTTPEIEAPKEPVMKAHQQYDHPQPVVSATRKEDKQRYEKTNGNPKENEKSGQDAKERKEKSEEDGLAEAASTSRGKVQLPKFIRPKALVNLALFVLIAVVLMLYAIRSLEKPKSSDGL